MNLAIATMIRQSGRSWWEARYSDGHTLGEWDTTTTTIHLPVGLGKSSRWEEVPKDHMVALRLLCPNGQAGELEAPEGHRFFQLKQGAQSVPIGFGGKAERYTICHIIGVVENIEGDCLCRAWEEGERKTCPEFEALEYKSTHIAAPQDIAKVTVSLNVYRSKGYGKYSWRLIEFRDNIAHMKYRGIGALNLDVQQMKV